jgi:hypothetical protein
MKGSLRAGVASQRRLVESDACKQARAWYEGTRTLALSDSLITSPIVFGGWEEHH